MDTLESSLTGTRSRTTGRQSVMRIIAVGDIHMDGHCFSKIAGIGSADLLILNGDLTNFGSSSDAKQVIRQARRANPNVLAQFGNLDHPEVDDYLDSLGINLHNRAVLVDNRVCLVGIGGSNPTPFATPSEFSEPAIAAMAEKNFAQARQLITKLRSGAGTSVSSRVEKNTIPLILVSHAPPHRTRVDRLVDGSSTGSVAIRTCIEREAPALCICGHIHEAAGTDMIGTTPIYNPGMLRNGGWIEIELNNQNIKTTLHDSL